jgi:hypothetical protein
MSEELRKFRLAPWIHALNERLIGGVGVTAYTVCSL